MSRKLLASAALGLCLVAGGPARAGDFNQPIDGGYLTMMCESDDEGSRTICTKYLLGVWDTLQTLQKLERARARVVGGPVRPTTVCINHDIVIDPDIPTADAKLRKIFLTWANQHRESTSGNDAVDAAMQAFMAAYPCKQTAGAR